MTWDKNHKGPHVYWIDCADWAKDEIIFARSVPRALRWIGIDGTKARASVRAQIRERGFASVRSGTSRKYWIHKQELF